MTAVPISMRLVRTPIAASSGNGEESCRAKWWTRTKAPSTPSSSAATASSTVCASASAAVRVADHSAACQCPNERKPIRLRSTPPTYLSAQGLGQQPADRAPELVGQVRLLQERLVSPGLPAHDVAGIAGREEHLEGRPACDEPVGEVAAVHAGHDDVRDEHVDRAVVALGKRQRLFAVRRGEDAV